MFTLLKEEKQQLLLLCIHDLAHFGDGLSLTPKQAGSAVSVSLNK